MAKDNFIEQATSLAKNKNLQIGLFVAAFLLILVLSTNMRLSNVSIMKDQTTGDYTLADLDAQYFFRIAETIVANGGSLPELDHMRTPALGVEWLKELLPRFIVLVYNIGKIFDSEFSVIYAAALSPVILYAIGLIFFLLLSLYLTKSKLASIIAVSLLAYSPAYISRSVFGFADHDIMGMAALFLGFFLYAISLKNFEKTWRSTLGYGILSGFAIALIIASWGGAVTFAITVVPFAFFFHYLLNVKDKNKSIAFLAFITLFSIIFSVILGLSAKDAYSRFLGSYGLLIPFVLVFMIVDVLLEKSLANVKESKFIQKRFEKFYSIIITIILGSLALPLVGNSIFSVMSEIWFKLLFPFGSLTGRLSSTVAENAQPYLNDWISLSGNFIFTLFVLGAILIGFELVKHSKSKKERIILSAAWTYLIISILFSRISSSSTFNGENFTSQLFYLSGLIIFFGSFIYFYTKEKFHADSNIILLFSIIFFTVINGRSAVRIFLLIAPFVCLSAGYLASSLLKYSKEVKEDAWKKTLAVAAVIVILLSAYSLYTYYPSTSSQAKYIGPSTNYQWQNAMAWVRDNTSPNDIFVHWWDYGYWIQTIGKRPTVTDGGHAAGDAGDQNIGRYILTTPDPVTAFSYMKTWNVSYLLIDPTDFGKYGAYSKIGSNQNYDRFSFITESVLDESQTVEKASETVLIYPVSGIVDEDLRYNGTFLPGPSYDKFQRPNYKSYIVGVSLTIPNANNGTGTTIKQPVAYYVYNNKQYLIPLRYLYLEGQMHDFGSGIDGVFMVVPKIQQDSQGAVSKNQLGAGIYLSPKVQKGLFARLYLMNDPFNQYPSITLAHKEDDYVVTYLNQQGISTPEIIYFNGLRAPLKIWKVNYPSNTQTHEEFLNRNLESYGALDRLFY